MLNAKNLINKNLKAKTSKNPKEKKKKWKKKEREKRKLKNKNKKAGKIKTYYEALRKKEKRIETAE